MEITYTNYHGTILTEQQIKLVDSYIKVFKVTKNMRFWTLVYNKDKFYTICNIANYKESINKILAITLISSPL